MITNKKELILAAQEFGLKSIAETDDHKRGVLRHAAFSELGISGKHYDEFRQLSENCRHNYINGELTKLEPAA